MKRIRVWDPGTPLILACRPGLGEFFLKHKLVDDVIEVNKKSREGRACAFKRLRENRWDVIFVPHESPRTALWITRLKARTAKVGFAKWWNRGIYRPRVVKPVGLPDALRQLSLLAPLDPRVAELFATEEVQSLRSPSDQTSPLDFHIPDIPDWASMKVNSHRPVGSRVFLAPGSVWATKRWTATGYEALARELQRRGHEVILVGSRAEADLCASIAARVAGVKNRAGATSLNDLVELFSTGRALVCNDSGAMHAAAAADLPTVAIFGPTTLDLGFRPWQNRAVVVQSSLSCRPCGKHGAQTCPLGTHECMEKINATEVLSALDRIL
ncbi:MAG: glycosyltransferase family 9 protein [Bdellovibrionales bacterium]